jgi:hypothetical protein
MPLDFEGLVYLMAGLILMVLYVRRARGFPALVPDLLPELHEETFEELKTTLRKSYQRTLYLAVAFLYLAFVTIAHRSPSARVFGIVVTAGLFFYNIPPRNRVMSILSSAGLDRESMKRRGLKF